MLLYIKIHICNLPTLNAFKRISHNKKLFLVVLLQLAHYNIWRAIMEGNWVQGHVIPVDGQVDLQLNRVLTSRHSRESLYNRRDGNKLLFIMQRFIMSIFYSC